MALRKSLSILATMSAAALATGMCTHAATAQVQSLAQLQHAAVQQASQLTNTLGASSGGYWLDHGKAVVNVLDDASARKVEAAGLTAKKVKHSFAQLTQAKNQLDTVKNVPQTAWGIDTRANQVVVKIYSAAKPEVAKKVAEAAARLGDSARIEHRTGKLELYI